MAKPRIGIYGLTGCAGDQLAILNCEDELLDIVNAVDLRSFSMASSSNPEGEIDVAFVEGAVCQQRDLDELKEIRSRSKLLIAIGTCAVWGGVAAARNDIDREKLKEKVYGPSGSFLESLPVKPLGEHVKVDLAISGCPIEKEELINSVASLLRGDLPLLVSFPVCTSCKMHEYECLLVKRGQLCLGPITRAGCEARCPGLNRVCRGCRGPVDEPNAASEVALLKERGFDRRDIINALATFAAPAEKLAEQIVGKEPACQSAQDASQAEKE